MPETVLPVTGPFDFALTARVLARLPNINRLEVWDADAQEHRRALQTTHGPVVVTARAAPGGLWLSHDNPEAVSWATESFGLAHNPSAFYRAVKNDAVLHQATKTLRGLRPPLLEPWEAWVAAILGQQITLAFCLQQINAIGDRFGGTVVHEGRTHLLHPSPEAILDASEQDLLACKVSRRKSEYLKTLAEATLQQKFEDILDLPLPEALERLVKLRGVGLWTARFWLATRGRMDSLAYGDAGLNSAYGIAYGKRDGIETWGEALGAVRGWVYWYLIWATKYQA